MKELEVYIENYLGIGGKDLSPVASLFQNTRLSKNEFLLKKGQYTQTISFVKSGYLRIFAPNADGHKDITQWISTSGMFVTDLSSFIFGAPARWNIQALSDCELFTISKEKYDQIGDYVDNWEKLDKLFIAKCFVTLENRVFNQLSMTAEEKSERSVGAQSGYFSSGSLAIHCFYAWYDPRNLE